MLPDLRHQPTLVSKVAIGQPGHPCSAVPKYKIGTHRTWTDAQLGA
jgi:hypothetical protein